MVLKLKTRVMSKLISIVLTVTMLCGCLMTAGMSSVFAENTVSVSANTAADVVGNNFYADSMPKFQINFSGAAGNYEVSYKAVNKYDEVVWSKTGKLHIGTAGKAIQLIEIDALYFGVLKLLINITQNGTSVGSLETYYTLSNHTDDMPHNMRSGAASQVSWLSGSEDAHVSLLNGAGLGYLRSNDLAWEAMEIEKGKFTLVEDNVTETDENSSKLERIAGTRKLLSGLNENGIKYIALLGVANPLYTSDGSTVFGGSDAEYARLQEYAKYLADQTTYPIDVIEVTNEWHSPSMTGSEANSSNAQMLARITKAVYDGVTASTNTSKPKVSGIDEDSWGLYHATLTQAGQAQNGMIPKYIDAMQALGTKPYDLVSVHPYSEDTTPFETSIKSNVYIDELKALLESEDYAAPFIFTEIGWDNQDGVSDEQQAAWLVRANAYIQYNKMSEIVCNYHMADYTRNDATTEMGLVNNWQNGGEYGVPYLGKEAYTAMAYYNGLMAYADQDNISAVDADTASDDDYCYNFAPAESGGDRVLMYGLYTEDAAPVTKYLNVGVSTVTLSDMHGNERKVKTANGVVEITLDDTPDYLIGNFDTVTVESGAGEEATAIGVVNDMEDAANLKWYDNTATKGGAMYAVKADDDDKGNVLHMYSRLGEAAATKTVRPMVELPEGVKKAVISFDVKAEFADKGYLTVSAVGNDQATSTNKEYMIARLENTTKSYVYNNWQDKFAEAPLDTNQWTRIDMVIDMEEENIVVYKNGVEAKRGDKTENYATLTDIKKVYITCNTEIKDGSEVDGSFYLDNFAIIPIDEVAAKPASIRVWNGKTIYINMPATMSADSTIAASGNYLTAADGSKVLATAQLVGKTTIKLTTEQELSDSIEYKVSFGNGTVLKTFLGKVMSGEIRINKNTATMHKTLYETSFDETIWIKLAYAGYPDGFSMDADRSDIIAAVDPADESNYVLRFKDADNADWVDRLIYTIDGMPATKVKFRLDYRLKMAKANEEDTFGWFCIRLRDEDSTASAANRETSGMSLNNAGRGIDYYTGNNAWIGATNGNQALVEQSAISMTDWYTYNNEFTFEESETYIRPLANYSVSDKDGKGVASTVLQQTCNPTVDWVDAVRFDFYDVDGQDGDEAYMDDLYIGYSYANMAEPGAGSGSADLKAVLVKADGTETMVSSQITADVIGLKLTLGDKAANEIIAEISDGSETTVTRLSDTEYLVKWSDRLNGSYILEVFDGANMLYEFSFKAVSDKSYDNALLYTTDFEYGHTDFYSGKTDAHTLPVLDTLNSKAIYLADNGDATEDAITPRFKFTKNVQGGKVLTSFDIMVDGTKEKAQASLNMLDENGGSQMALVLRRDSATTFKNWLYNNWNASYQITDEIVSHSLRHVDVVYDLDHDVAEIYVDGVFIKAEEDIYGKLKANTLSGMYINMTEGVYIDNVRALDADDYEVTIVDRKFDAENAKVMYAELSTVLGSDYSGNGKLVDINSGSENPVTVAGAKGGRFLTITAQNDIDTAAAYSFNIIGAVPVDILGNAMGESVRIATGAKTTIEKRLITMDFEDNVLPAGLSGYVEDGAASSNTALVANGELSVNSTKWMTGVRYDLPTDLPDSYTLKVSYRAKLTPETDSQTFGSHFIQLGTTSTIKNASIAMATNFDNLGNIIYVDQGKYWSGTRVELVPASKITSFADWYTYECEFAISSGKKPVGSYKVKDADGNLLGEISDKELALTAEILSKPESVFFAFRSVNANNGSTAIFDDITISYSYEDDAISKFAFVGTDGSEFAPTYAPDKAVSGAVLGFNKPVYTVSATMTAKNGGEVAVSCTKLSDYSVKVNIPEVEESKIYTLSINYDGKVFDFDFVPMAAVKEAVSGFGVFMGDAPVTQISQLTAPATLKVKATVCDLENTGITANLIYVVYQNGIISQIGSDSVTATPAGVPLEKEFTITDTTGVTIKAMLWNTALGKLVPLAEVISIQ